MGTIDLDPWSTAERNHVIQAATYLEQDDLEVRLQQPWSTEPGKRALLALPSGLSLCKALANRTFELWKDNQISQAILWFGTSEILASCPWLWDYPICIPFRRLAPCFWDDELEETIRVSPGTWSPIIHLPPISRGPSGDPLRDGLDLRNGIARFHAATGGFGRVVFDRWSGEHRWLAAYQAEIGRPFWPDP
jgi:hypothetical protein